MKKIEVVIEGVTPLLMHSPKAMMESLTKANKVIKASRKAKEYDMTEEAEKGAYRMKDGGLYIPSEAVYRCILNGASWYKINKRSAGQVLAGAMRIEPLEVSLGTKHYEIDLRTVVIQRNRIIRARPLLRKWSVKFSIVYNDRMIDSPEIIKNALIEAGERVGLLEFSPRNKGSFGCFQIKSWKPQKE